MLAKWTIGHFLHNGFALVFRIHLSKDFALNATSSPFFTRKGMRASEAATFPATRAQLGITVAIIFVLVFSIFGPGIRAEYFSDDYLFFNNTPKPWLDHFTSRGAAPHAYRPLEALILSTIQQRFGFDTLLIHLLSFTSHALLCCLVLMAARRLELSAAQSIVAVALVLVTQVAAPALVGNDTLSQAASTLSGVAGVYFFFVASRGSHERSEHPTSRWKYAAAVLLLGVSVLFKETAIGYFAVAAVLAIVFALKRASWWQGIRQVSLQLAALILLGAAYLVLRWFAGGPLEMSGPGPYSIRVGTNVASNLAAFAFIATNPFSTITTGLALQTHALEWLALAAAASLVVTVGLVIGVLLAARKRLCMLLFVCTAAALFPTYFLAHVSELYLYNAMPFLALAFGVSFGTLWEYGRAARIAALVCLAALVIGQLAANRDKTSRMIANGQRATMLIRSISSYMAELPPNSRLYLVNPWRREARFSVYIADGFDVLEFGAWRMGELHGRPDIKVRVISEELARTLRPDPQTFLLTLDGPTGIKRVVAP